MASSISVIVTAIVGLIVGLAADSLYTILVRFGARVAELGQRERTAPQRTVEDLEYRLSAYHRFSTLAVTVSVIAFTVSLAVGILPSLTAFQVSPLVLGLCLLAGVATGEILFRLGAERRLSASAPASITPVDYEAEAIGRLKELLGGQAHIQVARRPDAGFDGLITSDRKLIAVEIFAGTLFTGNILRQRLAKMTALAARPEALLIVVNGLPSRRGLENISAAAREAGIKLAVATWIPGFGDSDLKRALRELGLEVRH